MNITTFETEANVTLWSALQLNGPISFYQVVVYHADERTGETRDARKDVSFHNASVVGKTDAYIAAEIPAASVKPSLDFVLGDGRHYGHFTNPKLARGQKYNVYSRALTTWNSKTLFGAERLIANIDVKVRHPFPDILPRTVLCKRYSTCYLWCYADSDKPVNYTWTKSGRPVTGTSIRTMDNILIVATQTDQDYGIYVSHAENSGFEESYEITLSEETESDRLTNGKSVLGAVIGLCCLLFILVIVIMWLIWRLRRSLPKNCETSGQTDCQFDKRQNDQESQPASYMELRPRPGHEQQPTSSAEYQELHLADKNPGYYNIGFRAKRKEEEEVYEEINVAQA